MIINGRYIQSTPITINRGYTIFTSGTISKKAFIKNLRTFINDAILSVITFAETISYAHIFIYTICLFTFIYYTYNLYYSSPFNDEAIYVVVGRLGVFQLDWKFYNSASWIGGNPYFYPTITALTYSIGGISGSRLFNVVLGILTVEIVFIIVRLLSSTQEKYKILSGLTAAVVMGSSGISYFVSRIATLDAPSFYFFFLGILTLIYEYKNKTSTGKWYFLSYSFLFIALMFKYIVGIFIPFLFLLSYFINRKTSLYYWKLYFFLPLTASIVIYFLAYFPSLTAFYSEQIYPNRSTLQEVFEIFWNNTNVILLFYLTGSVGMIMKKEWKQWAILSFFAFLIPLVHIAAVRSSSFDRHLFPTVVFFSLVTGIGIGNILSQIDGKLMRLSIFGMLAIALIFSWINSYYSVGLYTTQWTNSHNIMVKLIDMMNVNDKVLSEDGAYALLAAYEKNHPANIFTFDWLEYRGKEGTDAYADAVRDGYFKLILLNEGEVDKSDEKYKINNIVKQKMENNYKLYAIDNGLELYIRQY